MGVVAAELREQDLPILFELWRTPEVMRYADEFPRLRGWSRSDDLATAWVRYEQERAALAGETTETGAGMVLTADLDTLLGDRPDWESRPVRLLYRFDPLYLGVKDKGWLIDDAHYRRVWRPAGHIEPALLIHGWIAGTWRYDRAGEGVRVTVRPFTPLPAAAGAALAQEAAGVAGYLGRMLSDLVVDGD